MGITESKEKRRGKQKLEDFVDRLQRALIGYEQAKNTFATLSDLWLTSREETISSVSDIAHQLEQHHYNVNVANLTGASSSIAGGTAAVASIILAPLTGGVSTVLATGAICGTVVGTATTLGANVVEVLLAKELLDKAKEKLNADTRYTEALSSSFHELIRHENQLIEILKELRNPALLDILKKTLTSDSDTKAIDSKIKDLTHNTGCFDDVLGWVSCAYANDLFSHDDLQHEDTLFEGAPTLSSTVSTSSEFFQALKELSTLGPETLTNLSGAAIQSTSVSGGQIATLGGQVLSIGLGAVFVALDVHHFIQTSRNFDEGSRTELTEKIRRCIVELGNEVTRVKPLANYYKEHMDHAKIGEIRETE